ncbi:hypothetical protein KQI84_06495 [bacterium]|nr:hypothetical protein [bacterium]
MDKEKLILLGKKLMKRADRVAIVLFLALLLATGYIWFRETNTTIPPPEPTQLKPWNQAIPSPEYENVVDQLMQDQTDITQDPDVRIIVQNNMFDLKSVRSQAEQERQIRQDYQEAERMFLSSDYDGALERLNTILQQNPNHTKALELKQRIEDALAPPSEGEAEGTEGGDAAAPPEG